MANGTEKAMEQPAWIQAPSFQYFTLLDDVPGAILLIDAPRNQSILFAPEAPRSFGVPIPALDILADEEFATRSAVDAVLPIDRMLALYREPIERRRFLLLYLDEPPARTTPTKSFRYVCRSAEYIDSGNRV